MLQYIIPGPHMMLYYICPPPDVMLHHICSASGRYALLFCSHPDVMPEACFRIYYYYYYYYYMMRASGRYPLSSDVLLMSLSFIIWCLLPAHLAYDVCLRTLSFII